MTKDEVILQQDKDISEACFLFREVLDAAKNGKPLSKELIEEITAWQQAEELEAKDA